MSPLPVSLIVPTYNMCTHLRALLQSIAKSGLVQDIQEIVIVNDGSTDETKVVIEEFRPEFQDRLVAVNLDKNKGRFEARRIAALKANSKFLLFLDSRVEIKKDFRRALQEICPKFSVVQGVVDIPVEESLFNLYWDRSHRFIFRKNYEDQAKGLWLDTANFDKYTVGTGIFYVEKELFLWACHQFSTPPLSDDIALIQEICQKQKIWVTEKLSVDWRPRQELGPFLARLWERGPSFVAYHVYGKGSPLRKYVYAGLVAIFINAFLFTVDLSSWMKFALIELGLVLSSIFLFTRRPVEALKLMPLHLAVVLTFGFSILRGLCLEWPVLKQKRRNE